MQLPIDFFATRLTEDEYQAYEDSNRLEDWKASGLCKYLRTLTNSQLLARYEAFLERNADNPYLHVLEGYRLLRGRAYGEKLFDAIDAIDREKGRSDDAASSTN